MGEIVSFVQAHWAFIAFVLGCFIQFNPAIKFNPLEALGNIIFKKLYARIDKVEERIDKVNTRQMQDEKDRIRQEVLRFANSLRNEGRHTKDEFQHIIDQNDKYEDLLKETNDKNGVFTAEFEYIKETYRQRQEQNDFLA